MSQYLSRITMFSTPRRSILKLVCLLDHFRILKIFGVNNPVAPKCLTLNSNRLEAHPKVRGEFLVDDWPKLSLMFLSISNSYFFVRNQQFSLVYRSKIYNSYVEQTHDDVIDVLRIFFLAVPHSFDVSVSHKNYYPGIICMPCKHYSLHLQH